MPTFEIPVKGTKKVQRVSTTEPGEVARFRAAGYPEEKPKTKTTNQTSSNSQSVNKKTTK